MSAVAWRPTPEVVEHANLTRLMRRHGIARYRELVARSIEQPEWFWPAVVDDLGLDFAQVWERVLDDSRGIEWATWFRDARLNVATNCVHRHVPGRGGEVAVVSRLEDGSRQALTFDELSSAVTRLAEGLASLGVRAGDRVALLLPMSAETAIASHACAHLGAIQVPIFSGFGASAIAERLVHSGVRLVVTADGSLRRGKRLHLKETLDEALRQAQAVEHVVVWRRLGLDCPMTAGRDVFWDELTDARPGELAPLDVDAEHPYLIAYTSGTTGKPKGAVHATAGFLVKISSEVAYEADVHPGDSILFATDLGWIMGPWTVVGAGALGATIVFLEGAPDWPDPGRLWSLVAEEQIDVLGLSPTLARALMACGDEYVVAHDRSSLRTFVTTGEPWNSAPYRWLSGVGDGHVPIVNVSGGTEIGACLLACCHLEPIKECSLGAPALGMAVDCVDSAGRSCPPGEVGELVCRAPWPAMTRGFWADPGGEHYLETYWRRIPGMWVHGDFASVDADGYWYLHGRSDDTLNIAGKRIGPAELESAAVEHPAIREAAAIGVPHEVKGEVAWLVCVPNGEPEENGLISEVSARVGEALGKAFTPDRVLLVPELPRTRSQKIVRRAVRAAVLGRDPGDLSSVENPDAVAAVAAAAREH